MTESLWDKDRRERRERIPGLREAHERTVARQKELRRTRLHYFGLAGGRRSR